MVAVLAGCGGGGTPAAATADAKPSPPLLTQPDAEPGRVLLRFAAAARKGDTGALWQLLSRPSRAGLGGFRDFERGTGATLVRSFRPLRAAVRLVLSRRVGDRWGVAALAGRRLEEGELEDFVYAGALRREGARWRLELGGLIVGGVRPEPSEQLEGDVAVRADVAAGTPVQAFLLWLDGQPVDARVESETPFAARIRADVATLRTGLHVGVAFAATADAAGAVAWPFTVE